MIAGVRRVAWRIAGPLGAAVAVALFAAPAVASAATFTVGSNADSGGCASPPTGNNCTLRQLVTSVPSGSTIIVPSNTYMLTAGELSIAQNMTIAGAGARTTIIEQQTLPGPARVFDVQPGIAATISGLSMLFGKADSTSTGGPAGGDVLNQGTLTLSEDEVADGQTTGGAGGGISNGRAATLTVTHSLIDGNQSLASSGTGGTAGGVENFTTRFTASHLAIDNSTIANNTAAAGGGGVLTDCAGSCTSTTTITNSTIASNDGGTAPTNAGGLLASGGTISVLNSIVAANTVSAGATASDCAGGGLITSLGHDLESASDCGFRSAGDFQNTNPQFLTGGLSDTGGNTDTIALAATSPAVDAIPASAPGCSSKDQRDIPRPQGTGCDIGAFELFQPVEGQQFSAVLGSIGAPRSASIDWGDGSAPSSPMRDNTTGQVTGTHTYTEDGIYHGVINWTNSDGTPIQTPFDLKVMDAPLSATSNGITPAAGTPFTGPVVAFSDADPAGTASDYSATISWGDGSSSPGTISAVAGGFTVNGTHTYAAIGTYPMTVSITDAGGASITATGTAKVGPPSAAPSQVVTGAPAVGSTTAGFAGSVTPDGLPTSAFFQYGLDPKYTGASGIAFTQSTPAQSVGSDFASHAVSASVSGLVPNALYHVRLVATNSAGTTVGPDVTFTTLKTAPPGSPVLGKSFNVSVVSGIVLIVVHGQLVPLTELEQLPAGTVIDTLRGTIKLTTALNGGSHASDAAAKGKKGKTKTQSGTFGGAIVKLTQAHNGLATLALVEGAFNGAPSYASCKAHKSVDASAAALSSKTLQLLHASAHGKFRTTGRYSAATVRGTKWTVADRCNGTLTHDITDSVSVSDFVRHTTIILHAGQSYLAKAPKHR